LKEEAQDRIKWRNRFGRGCGPVVWQITGEWMLSALGMMYPHTRGPIRKSRPLFWHQEINKEEKRGDTYRLQGLFVLSLPLPKGFGGQKGA
jgi:hypothetical protein